MPGHHDTQGRPLWYLGGDLAHHGAGLGAAELIDLARTKLAAVLPWLELGECHWDTVTVDRAEPRQPLGSRPDRAFVQQPDGCDNVLVAWPTKLTLCPDLAEQVATQLQEKNIQPSPKTPPLPWAENSHPVRRPFQPAQLLGKHRLPTLVLQQLHALG